MYWFAIMIKKNKQIKKLPVISFYLFKNPLMKEKNAISRWKLNSIKIIGHKVKSYICTLQGHT